KTAPPTRRDGTFESPEPHLPARYRGRPISQKSHPHSWKIRNQLRGRIFAAPRSTHRKPAALPPAKRPARPTDCFQPCSARPRRDSVSLTARSLRAHATPASASHHLHHPDGRLSASAAQLCPAAT